jgi:cobalamin biosynthesis protein CbiD
MSILGQEKNSILGNQGITTPTSTEQQVSKLHNQYSINGNPNLKYKTS